MIVPISVCMAKFAVSSRYSASLTTFQWIFIQWCHTHLTSCLGFFSIERENTFYLHCSVHSLGSNTFPSTPRGPFLNKSISQTFTFFRILIFFLLKNVNRIKKSTKYFSTACSLIFNTGFICHSSEVKPVHLFTNILYSTFKFPHREYLSHIYRSKDQFYGK